MSRIVDIKYEDQGKQRLDLFLTANFENHGYTRSYWAKMINAGYVKIGDSIPKAGYQLKNGEEISVEWPEIDRKYATKVKDIFEDDDVLVINKPAGMLTHSKGDFNPEFTVADYIASRTELNNTDNNHRAGIVHRLDRFTSGVLITARTQRAYDQLNKQFAERKTNKYYIAVVEGIIQEPKTIIDVPLSRDPHKPKLQSADQNGKTAKTTVFVVKKLEEHNVSIVLLKPETGRTHQLRVHLSYIGHPILGDMNYGAKMNINNNTQRFLLHAYKLCVSVPNNSEMSEFIAPIPQDMSSYIADDINTAVNELIDKAED